MQDPVGFICALVLMAFICELVDSTLGMGYGTTLTPLLLLLGYSPLQVVPVILISELVSGLLAGLFHHREGNVDLWPRTMRLRLLKRQLRRLGLMESIRRGFPKHLKIALLLAACSIVGTVAAVVLAVNLPKFWLKLYIGTIVLAMGITILACYRKEFPFSWTRIIGLGSLASFNKGISGGGYGPVVTSGQILAGVEGKSAVGITSLAEGLTCAVGITSYLLIATAPIDLRLAPYITLGAVLSVPLSAKCVKMLPETGLKLAIALLTIALGLLTIGKTLL